MPVRWLCIVLLLASLLIVPSLPVTAEETPDLKRLHAAVQKLVTRHYPKAEVTLEDGKIHFEHKARKFMVHETTRLGEWQDAFEELGPNKGGIVGDIEYQPGPYAGMAALPYTVDKRYYIFRMTAGQSKKLDAHLLSRLKHPRAAPAEFVKDFETLVGEFEKYVEP